MKTNNTKARNYTKLTFLYLMLLLLTFQMSIAKNTLNISKVIEGRTIQTPKGTKLNVIKYIDKGKRGLVYQVKDKHGKTYALKIARNNDKETIESIKKEPSKMDGIKNLGLRFAEIVEYGDNFILKEFAEGIRADQWYIDWSNKGASQKDRAFKALLALYKKSSDQGAYINDLNHKNLFWDGKAWTIIDSASIQYDLDPDEALLKFHKKMVETFKKDGACPRLVKILGLK